MRNVDKGLIFAEKKTIITKRVVPASIKPRNLGTLVDFLLFIVKLALQTGKDNKSA